MSHQYCEVGDGWSCHSQSNSWAKGRRDSSRDKLAYLIMEPGLWRQPRASSHFSLPHNLLARRLISVYSFCRTRGFPPSHTQTFLLTQSSSCTEFSFILTPKDFPCNPQTSTPVLDQCQTVKFQKTLTLSDKYFQTAIIPDSSDFLFGLNHGSWNSATLISHR